MNIYMLLIVVVLLLGLVVAVTLGKTKWKRAPVAERAQKPPLERRRVSGGDDD
jgi:hypothetical protein